MAALLGQGTIRTAPDHVGRVLEGAHPHCPLGKLVDAAGRNPDHALVVGVDDVAGMNGDPADFDWTIDRAKPEGAVMNAGPAAVGGKRG